MSYDYVDERPHYLHPRDPIVVNAVRPVSARRRMASDGFARRPLYYSSGGGLLAPEYSTGLHRSRSTGGRHITGPPPPAPVVINNIQADEHHRGRPLSAYDYDDWEYDEREPSPLSYSRGRSPRRYHHHSRPVSVAYSRESSPYRDPEVEAMKEKLRKFELDKQREEEEQRIKDELLLKAAKEAEAKRQEAERQKEIEKKAIEDWKKREEERLAREKKEKEEREKEYQERYRKDLEKLGFTNRDVGLVVRREVDLSKTTFTKMARRHISIETLRAYGVEWKFDNDPEYVIIKRWVPEHEQEIFWEHTRRIREARADEERISFIVRAQEEDRARKMIEEKKSKKKEKKRGFFG